MLDAAHLSSREAQAAHYGAVRARLSAGRPKAAASARQPSATMRVPSSDELEKLADLTAVDLVSEGEDAKVARRQMMWPDLHDVIEQAMRSPTRETRAIAMEICEIYGVPFHCIVGESRIPQYVKVRQVVCYAIRHKAGRPLRVLHNLLSIDHTTAMHAAETVEQALAIPRWDAERARRAVEHGASSKREAAILGVKFSVLHFWTAPIALPDKRAREAAVSIIRRVRHVD